MKHYKIIKHNPDLAHSTLDKNTLTDVTCDVCQKSCLSYQDDVDDSLHFDFLEIQGSFGYWSKSHDGEAWTAQVCESCSENHLEKIICFEKYDYLTGAATNKSEAHKKYKDDWNAELNKKSNRIRKVRKLTGDVEFEIKSKED